MQYDVIAVEAIKVERHTEGKMLVENLRNLHAKIIKKRGQAVKVENEVIDLSEVDLAVKTLTPADGEIELKLTLKPVA